MTQVPERVKKELSKGINHGDTETLGLIYGFVGVLGFSGTLPATRVAVADLDPTFVGLGRAVVAAILAAAVLVLTRQSFPPRKYWKSFAVIVAGVIIGFPLLSAWALRQLPASHAAIVTGLLPLATAIAGAFRAGERPSLGFWLASVVGSGTVVAFAIFAGSGTVQVADIVLVGAVAAAGIGYAEGGRLARELGGWQVISWALVFAAPLLIVPVTLSLAQNGVRVAASAWIGFAYVSVVSQFLGFFAWYHGLVIGGIARVGQVQLLQPFLTILFSALLLNEQITLTTVIAALIVVASVAVGRKQPIFKKDSAR